MKSGCSRGSRIDLKYLNGGPSNTACSRRRPLRSEAPRLMRRRWTAWTLQSENAYSGWVTFTWDPKKAEENLKKHGVDFREAATRNADAVRRPLVPMPSAVPPVAAGVAPLLASLLRQYRATGLPPAYRPTDDDTDPKE